MDLVRGDGYAHCRCLSHLTMLASLACGAGREVQAPVLPFRWLAVSFATSTVLITSKRGRAFVNVKLGVRGVDISNKGQTVTSPGSA